MQGFLCNGHLLSDQLLTATVVEALKIDLKITLLKIKNKKKINKIQWNRTKLKSAIDNTEKYEVLKWQMFLLKTV